MGGGVSSLTWAVVIPVRRPGDEHRERALAWTHDRYLREALTVLYGHHYADEGPFNRSLACLRGAALWQHEGYIFADGDCWVEIEALSAAMSATLTRGWSVPHKNIHRLSADSTRLVLEGTDWRGLPLSTDNRRDARPYRGNECGTLVCMTKDVLWAVPPDVRFVGWGQEDEAWAFALRTLVGPPWRGDADLVHLWHPPQPRQDRRVGSPAGAKLLHRYRQAQGQKRKMRALIDESKELWTPALLEQLQK